jgi:S1-C subfamily serine protease
MKKEVIIIFSIFTSLILYGGTSDDPRVTPTVKAVAKALPSVVNIGTERIVSISHSPWGSNDPFEQLFRNFYAQQKGRKETSLGSGSIISKQGLIVTNSHVVHRATRIIVTMSDGKQYIAKEIAGDSLNDIALLQLINIDKSQTFQPMPFAKPDSLLLGEPVIAVGNPYGLGSSISRGVLSATRRKISFNGKILFGDILQTDAAINPGNSGGPLININGEMIGINTAIYGEADGIGFAIPLKRIELVLATWMIPEKFSDVSLGIIPGEKIQDNEVLFFIREVLPNSPAWRSGIRAGDVITAVNGEKIKNLMEISNKLWNLKSGDQISCTIAGKGTITLTVEELKSLDGKTLAANRLGLGLEKLTLNLAKALRYPFHGGLLVNNITNRTTKSVRRGEVLVRIDNVPIYEFSDIRRALNDKHYGDAVNAIFISIVHNGAKKFITKRNSILKVQ